MQLGRCVGSEIASARTVWVRTQFQRVPKLRAFTCRRGTARMSPASVTNQLQCIGATLPPRPGGL